MMSRSGNWPGTKENHRGYDEIDDLNQTVQAQQGTRKNRITSKCCCFWCILLSSILILTFFLLLFFVIVPSLAQSATNNSQIIILDMSLSNATNNSINMNVTMNIVNTGPLSATINSVKATAHLSDGSYVGTLSLPKIDVQANKGAIFKLNEPLIVENRRNFQQFTKKLLSGQDSSLLIKSHPNIEVKILGITIQCRINMEHEMVLNGASMENSMTNNFKVTQSSTDGTQLIGKTEISFSTSCTMNINISNIRIDIHDKNDIYLGYTMMNSLEIKGGYNFLDNLTTTVEKKNIGFKNRYKLFS